MSAIRTINHALISAGACAAAVAAAAQTAPPAPPAASATAAAQVWGKAAENHIFAQTIVNQAMAANPDLVSLGLHAVPPGSQAAPGEPGQVIVAQVIDRIGAPDGPSDLEVTKLDEVRIYQAKLDNIMRMRVMLPLRDSQGRKIGLTVMLFKLDNGITPLAAHLRADAILKTISARIPDKAALFKPAG